MVSPSSSSEQSNLHRLIGAILLAFFIFLPLHYHVITATSQLAKECTCVHGTRTQLLLAPDVATVVPPVPTTFIADHYVFSWTGDWSRSKSVRGPPVSL